MSENSHRIVPFEIERQMLVERRHVIDGWVRGRMRALARSLRALPMAMSRLMRDWAAQQQLHKAIRELRRFDDRTLADIGLTRGEIELMVRGGQPADRLPRPWHHPRSSTNAAA